jgi:flagellar protein FlbD
VIKLTRLDGSHLTVSANFIELIEANPDTVVTLITNKKFLVRETPEEIAQLVVAHYKETGGTRLIVYTDCAHPGEDHAA